MPQQHPRVALVDIRDHDLSLDEVLSAVRRAEHGAVVTFTGVVRNHDDDKGVDALSYSAHPSATDLLVASCARVAETHPEVVLAAVHRVGDLALGDLAVVLAVGAPHRGDAFDACRALIDDLKATVPIWKHQRFADGSDEWVGLP